MFYMAQWVFDSPEISDGFQFELEKLRPVEIKCIIKHTIQADDVNFTYLLARGYSTFLKGLSMENHSSTLIIVLYQYNF